MTSSRTPSRKRNNANFTRVSMFLFRIIRFAGNIATVNMLCYSVVIGEMNKCLQNKVLENACKILYG